MSASRLPSRRGVEAGVHAERACPPEDLRREAVLRHRLAAKDREPVCKAPTREPERFGLDPLQQMLGLRT